MTTSRYKLIEKLGVTIYEARGLALYEYQTVDDRTQAPKKYSVVCCDDLEPLLAKAPRVTSTNGSEWYETKKEYKYDTHQALLICVETLACEKHQPIVESRQVIQSSSPEAHLMLGCKIVCAKCRKELEVKEWVTK